MRIERGEIMAHLKKFSRGSAARILEHCERVKDENGKFRKYRSASEIDDSRTKDNYSFLMKGYASSGKDRLGEILTDTYCMNRSDVNVMADWVVTLPKDYQGDEREFFKQCSIFVMNRYGKESYIGGWVHKDESQPHIHLCFVPRVYDEKKERWKVCAKSRINKSELQTFHADLEQHLIDHGVAEKGQIVNGITKETGGNKTIPELKALTEKYEAWQQNVNNHVEQVEGLLDRLSEYIPQKDIQSISKILEEIKGYDLGSGCKPEGEFVITPSKIRRKERVK